MKIYVVTGALGHLGNTIASMLLARGENVRCLALPDDTINCFDGTAAVIYRGDVCKPDSLRAIMSAEPDDELIVIHAAGIVSIASHFNQKVYDINVTGTRNIINMCREYGAKKLVYISSVHAICPHKGTISETDRFDPQRVGGLYAKTKAEASALVLAAAQEGLDASIVHPSGIIGPYDYGKGHLGQLIIDYLEGRLTAAVSGGYDFVDVRDVAHGAILAADNGRAGECYILSGGYHPISELLDTLHDITGKRKIRVYLPAWFARLTAPLSEAYYKMLKEPPLYTAYSLKTLSENSRFSCAKACAELGYAPRAFRQTLEDTVAWMEKNGRIHMKSKPCRHRQTKRRVSTAKV